MRIVLNFIALLALAVPAAAMAESSPPWRSAVGDDHCDLRYYRGDMMVFMVRSTGDGSYSLSGEAFRDPDTGENIKGAVEVRTEQESLLLNSSTQAMQRQTLRRRLDPLNLFAQSLTGEASFDLVTEIGAQTIPLGTYVPAALAFSECGDALAQTINPRPPSLIAFDGINLLARAASRQRILSQPLTFIIAVDPFGRPTECETSRDFRRTATEIDLCRPILNYSRFEAATDASGNPTAGQYVMNIDYNSLIARRGSGGSRNRD